MAPDTAAEQYECHTYGCHETVESPWLFCPKHASSYYAAVTEPRVLTQEDEYKIRTLLKCRGCGERLIDGCLPGCTDRD